MPEFHRVLPVLKVSDLQRAVEFYTNVLGFSLCWRAANDGGGENAMLLAGATNLLLSTGSQLGETPQFPNDARLAEASILERPMKTGLYVC